MKTQLIAHTLNPELIIAASAHLCYKDVSAINLLDSLSPDEVEKLLNIIISSGHHSVLEHVTFTFAIDGVSRVLTHQLVRHRVGVAYSQQSQRYTSLENAEFVCPKSIYARPDMYQKYQQLIRDSLAFYLEAKEAGVPKEDARFGLVQGIETRLVMTVNMREFIHMYSINACFRSQWEIRELMRQMKVEVKKVSPRLAKELKIKCFTMGYCDEAHQCRQLKATVMSKEDFMKISKSKGEAEDYDE